MGNKKPKFLIDIVFFGTKMHDRLETKVALFELKEREGVKDNPVFIL